jgi:hypothetical protein
MDSRLADQRRVGCLRTVTAAAASAKTAEQPLNREPRPGVVPRVTPVSPPTTVVAATMAPSPRAFLAPVAPAVRGAVPAAPRSIVAHDLHPTEQPRCQTSGLAAVGLAVGGRRRYLNGLGGRWGRLFGHRRLRGEERRPGSRGRRHCRGPGWPGADGSPRLIPRADARPVAPRSDAHRTAGIRARPAGTDAGRPKPLGQAARTANQLVPLRGPCWLGALNGAQIKVAIPGAERDGQNTRQPSRYGDQHGNDQQETRSVATEPTGYIGHYRMVTDYPQWTGATHGMSKRPTIGALHGRALVRTGQRPRRSADAQHPHVAARRLSPRNARRAPLNVWRAPRSAWPSCRSL